MGTHHSSCTSIMPQRQIIVQGEVHVKIHIDGGAALTVSMVLAATAVLLVALLR